MPKQRAIATLLARVLEIGLRNLPSGLAARIDWWRPSLRSVWGGPLNGQVQRQRIVRELVRTVGFGEVIETGAFRGGSTEFLAAVAGVPVTTVEHSARYAEYTRRRCAIYPTVTVVIGDSREHLPGLTPVGDGLPVFYYLDAHWGPDLPLRGELATVRAAGRPAVVMIDDFRVPDDPGYAWDDYGPGAALEPAILDDLGLDDWRRLVPAARSDTETGARRGCLVLVHPALAGAVRTELLRELT